MALETKIIRSGYKKLKSLDGSVQVGETGLDTYDTDGNRTFNMDGQDMNVVGGAIKSYNKATLEEQIRIGDIGANKPEVIAAKSGSTVQDIIDA